MKKFFYAQGQRWAARNKMYSGKTIWYSCLEGAANKIFGDVYGGNGITMDNYIRADTARNAFIKGAIGV